MYTDYTFSWRRRLSPINYFRLKSLLLQISCRKNWKKPLPSRSVTAHVQTSIFSFRRNFVQKCQFKLLLFLYFSCPNPIYNYPSKGKWQIYDRCRSNNIIVNITHLPLPCRDKINMSVCGDVRLIMHITWSDGSSTVNVVRLGLMLIGLILNMSGRPCIIGGYNDNDHMSNTLWLGDLWHDL